MDVIGTDEGRRAALLVRFAEAALASVALRYVDPTVAADLAWDYAISMVRAGDRKALELRATVMRLPRETP